MLRCWIQENYEGCSLNMEQHKSWKYLKLSWIKSVLVWAHITCYGHLLLAAHVDYQVLAGLCIELTDIGAGLALWLEEAGRIWVSTASLTVRTVHSLLVVISEGTRCKRAILNSIGRHLVGEEKLAVIHVEVDYWSGLALPQVILLYTYLAILCH